MAHIQTAILKAALDADPPSINHVYYGWSLPVALPPDCSATSEKELNLVRCDCPSSRHCPTCRFSCSAAQLAWSCYMQVMITMSATMTVQELLQVLLMMDILQMNDICMRTVQVLIIHLLT